MECLRSSEGERVVSGRELMLSKTNAKCDARLSLRTLAASKRHVPVEGSEWQK